MSLAPGDRVGAYEVTAQLGAGAMGVVLRARDTKLLRDVALKVLPEQLASDPDRLSRLQREAQLLASLNHPNIAHVYGLEQASGGACIVMELVDGETLADRVQKGAIPLDEAVEIARQIVDALAAAHERGIVHRDLKPANIKLTPTGTVKVLDFGLAKPVAPGSGSGSGSSMLPTIDSGSMAGAIVGTVAYMSPEQARGKDVDARTDIWAFGCVLYEMLTGRLAFDGETATDIIAKVVSGQPDFDALPPVTPGAIRLLLTTALSKNVQQRLQHIGDARMLLDAKALATGAPAVPAAVAAPERKRGRFAVVVAAFVAGAALAGLAALAWSRRAGTEPAPPQLNLQLALPSIIGAPLVSPDGQLIAYSAEPPGDKRAIWIRPMGADSSRKLAGTDNPQYAGWAPDSRWLAFVADKKLKKVDVGSGSIQVLCDAPDQVRGLTWGRAGILFAMGGALVRVSADGGAVTPVTQLDPKLKETVHVIPVFLPDDDHFVYAIGSSEPEHAGIFVGALDGKTKNRLLPLGTRFNGLSYVPPGYLIVAGESLTAQRFDASALTLSGSAIPIVDSVDSYSASNTGLLLYRKVSATAAEKQLTWFDRAGRIVGQVGGKGNYAAVELSPAGDRVAVDMITEGNRDVWVVDVARGVPLRVSYDPASDWTPVWSPDGSRIAYASSRKGTHIYVKSASGVGNDEQMFKSESTEIPVSWSHDGRYLVFSRFKPPNSPGGVDTWLLTLGPEPKATPFVESPFDKAQARISPDGHWIAYATNDSGAYQIVVQTFPDPNKGRWQISAQGGIEPKWGRDGRELYYLAFDGNLMAVPVKDAKPDVSFEAGTPTALFQTPLTVSRTQSPRDRRYDVAADGRFLFAIPSTTSAAPVTVVVNWASGLEKK